MFLQVSTITKLHIDQLRKGVDAARLWIEMRPHFAHDDRQCHSIRCRVSMSKRQLSNKHRAQPILVWLCVKLWLKLAVTRNNDNYFEWIEKTSHLYKNALFPAFLSEQIQTPSITNMMKNTQKSQAHHIIFITPNCFIGIPPRYAIIRLEQSLLDIVSRQPVYSSTEGISLSFPHILDPVYTPNLTQFQINC